MFWTFVLILICLWLIGFLGGFMTSGFIHLLLVSSVVMILAKVMCEETSYYNRQIFNKSMNINSSTPATPVRHVLICMKEKYMYIMLKN